MYSSIKFLSTKSGKSVVLTVESKSYIFNLFEGFQRYCIESKVHLKNICAIFIPVSYTHLTLPTIYSV